MRSRGFTLIELLVVITIIAVLASVVLAALNTARENGRLSAGKQFEANIFHAEADQVVALYDFDDCTGTGITATAIRDRSGNGYNGTPGGVSWSADTPTGKGCSVNFSSGNNFSTPNLTFPGDYTFSLWVKPTAITASQCVFATISSGRLRLYFDPSNLFIVSTTVSTPAGVKLNTWSFITVAYDSVANKVSLYVDGALKGSGAPFSTIIDGSYFFGTSNGGLNLFQGLMDNVVIYAKYLTASEVGNLYASEAPRLKVAEQ